MFGKIKLPSLLLLILITACLPATADDDDETTLSSGPFLVAPTAHSVDWAVVNNGSESANLKVTVYRLDLAGPKVAVAPGTVAFTLAPGHTFHNANSVGVGLAFQLGFYYEVVVESRSEHVLPNVNQWDCPTGSCFIPATLIPAGDFVEIEDKDQHEEHDEDEDEDEDEGLGQRH